MATAHAYYRKIKHCGVAQLNETFKVFVNLLCTLLTSQQSLLVSAACKGLGLIGSVACLPIPDGSEASAKAPATAAAANDDDNRMQVDDGDSDKQLTKFTVMTTLLQSLKSAHSRPRVREEAAECLGHLAIGDGQFFTARNLETFLKLLKLVSGICVS